MSEPWRSLFDKYWANRPGAPYGHYPQRVFEAGFVAGITERVAVAKCDCNHREGTTNSELRVAKAEAWDQGALYAAIECNAIDDETQLWIADGDNPYRVIAK